MRNFIVIMLTCSLLLSAGCSNTAKDNTVTPNSDPGPSVNTPRENRQNEVVGKILSISESEIVLELSAIDWRNDARREKATPPDMDIPPSNDQTPPESPNDPPAPPREHPVRPADENIRDGDARPDNPPDLEFTGEEASFELTDSITIVKGRGDNSQTLAIADLVIGDVVRLAFDETEKLISIQLLQSRANPDAR